MKTNSLLRPALWLFFLSFLSRALWAQTSPDQPWDRTFGGVNSDDLAILQQTSDGGYILGGSSNSGVSGEKTQASRGDNDFWVVKLPACTNPSPRFTVAASCAGSATAFTDASTSVAANATYAWDFDNDGTVDSRTKDDVAYTYATTGTYTAKLTITQGTCTDSYTAQVEVKTPLMLGEFAAPTAPVAVKTSFCLSISLYYGTFS